jgi:hypothetical protein
MVFFNLESYLNYVKGNSDQNLGISERSVRDRFSSCNFRLVRARR